MRFPREESCLARWKSAASRQARNPPAGGVWSSRFEGHIQGLAFFCSERHFLVLFTQLFMHESQSVIAWGQTFDLKLAVRSRDCVERALRYTNEHFHPGMLIALHGEHDLLARKGLFEGRCLGSLRFVPLAIIFWCWVNVVRRRIAVGDLQGLSGHHAEHVGMISASALIQYGRVFWKGKGTVTQPLFHVYENVGQVAVGGHDVFG